MYSGIKHAIEGELSKRQPILLKNIQTVFDTILGNFDTTFVVEEIHDAKKDVLRLVIQEFVAFARTEINESITKEYDTAIKASR